MSSFSPPIEDNERIVAEKINRVYLRYPTLIKNLTNLNSYLQLGDNGMEQSIALTKELLLQFKSYNHIKEFITEIKKIKEEHEDSELIEEHIKSLEDIFQQLQTGDIVPFEFTVNTKYGNLIEKILNRKRKLENTEHESSQKYNKKQKRGGQKKTYKRKNKTKRKRSKKKRKSKKNNIKIKIIRRKEKTRKTGLFR